jgi:hypothetical protein
VNDLQRIFSGNAEGGLIWKWEHYFDVYERHLSRFRDTDAHVVEVGVYQGGSLGMWREYFGDRATIHGIDTNPRCKELESLGVKIHIGSQEDRAFLRALRAEVPRIDVLIDDGGHTMKQQKITFEELYPHLGDRGVYICEDLHTSYSLRYGGGYRRRGSFIEYSKQFIDGLNAWFAHKWSRLKVSEFTSTTDSLHYYAGMLVIEKRPVSRPRVVRSGKMKIMEGHRITPTNLVSLIGDALKKIRRA